VPRELGGDRRREVWVAKRLTRDIERKARHAGPAREARDRAAHDPAIECGHHAAALEHRQKRPGRQQPPFFFAHAQQHFRHRHRLGLVEGDDALRIKLELVLHQRLDQALYRLFPIGDLRS